jgi:hypothetical protein
MMLLSEAKVASMWESKGEAARRRRGCVGAMAALFDFEGDEADGEPAVEFLLAVFSISNGFLSLTFVILLCGFVNNGRML